MKDRIDELMDQSYVEYPHERDWDATTLVFDKRKFAELIVQKFDDILMLEYLDCVGNKEKQMEERIQRLRKKVNTYFGMNFDDE